MAAEHDPAALTPDLVGGAPLFLTGEDNLRLTVLNSAASVRVRLSGRFLGRDGRLSVFTRELAPTTDRVASLLLVTLGEGWLCEASIVNTAGAALIGQTWARLSIVRGSTGAIEDLSTLTQGSVTTAQRIGYPGGAWQGTLESAGAVRSITGTVPAAGAEISETVPTGARWELLAVVATLTTNGTVASRAATLRLDDGANPVMLSGGGVTQAASQAVTYVWSAGDAKDAAISQIYLHNPIPIGMRLAAGFRVRTLTVSMQAGDQWSAPQMLVREWIEGA